MSCSRSGAATLAGQLQRAAQRRQHAQRQHVDLQQQARPGRPCPTAPRCGRAWRRSRSAPGARACRARSRSRPGAATGGAESPSASAPARPLPRHARVRVNPQAPSVRSISFLPSHHWCARATASITPLSTPSARPVSRSAARPIEMTTAVSAAAVAAVLVVDVLDHFLAALVFEVHVDVGRLVAFLADEALEQRVAAYRVDLGDAQAIADGRVGGRAAAWHRMPWPRAYWTMS